MNSIEQKHWYVVPIAVFEASLLQITYDERLMFVNCNGCIVFGSCLLTLCQMRSEFQQPSPLSNVKFFFSEITDRYILRVHPNLEFHATCLKVSVFQINLFPLIQLFPMALAIESTFLCLLKF